MVDVGGGIGSTSMLLAAAFSPPTGRDLGLKFIIQDREAVTAMGEKVRFCQSTYSLFVKRQPIPIGVEGEVSRAS